LVVKLWCSSVWKFGENSIQSGVLGTVLSRSAYTARRRVAPRHVARAHHDHPMGPNAEATYHPPVHAPWGRLRRTAILTLSLCAMCSRPPRRPPNGVAAVRAQRRLVGNWPSCVAAHPAVPRPCHACTASPLALVCKEALNRLELGYKAGRSSPRESTEPPLSAIGALTVNSTPACFSSQTRAAPHSTRTPCSSCARLLACPSHRLTGASVTAAAAGQPSTSSAPRAIPEPTNRLSTTARSQ
jgi:hypothetical protein